MERPDLNLLYMFDVLVSEGSVSRAAKRLNLSSSATSRALARLRETMGDPLLVRGGRDLVPTPRALELQERVRQLIQESADILRPARLLELKGLERTFTLRSTEGFAENFGAAILARVEAEAPGARLKFVLKSNKDSAPLRDGEIDIETGIVDTLVAPEMHSRALFQERFVCVVHTGHPFAMGKVTLDDFISAKHIALHRLGRCRDPFDELLESHGVSRTIAAIVASFTTAIALAKSSNMVATIPERHAGNLLDGMHKFCVPVDLPAATISMIWHPRLHADPIHKWLRECIREVCEEMTRGDFQS